MNMRVSGRHIEINDSIRSHIDKKVQKLERYLPRLDEVKVELSKNATRSTRDRFTCQLTVWDHRNILRSEENSGTIYTAIDSAVKKLSHQIEKVRGRQKNHHHASLVENVEALLTTDPNHSRPDYAEEEPGGQIVRRKTFPLPSMDEDEAIEQMELIGHNFFLFLNPDGNAVNLIYQRHDGNYGLLQPQIG